MSNIQENLALILSAVWGKDVRQAIHDAIYDCYEDASSGTIDLPARERLDVLEAESATKDELEAETTARTEADTAINTTIGTVSMGTSATTLKGAIKELLTKINTNISNISTNTTNISTNRTNITTNRNNISTNTTNISTNRTNITTNRNNISTINTKLGSVSMGTSATTITGAIKELLTKITTNVTNISNLTTRTTALESGLNGVKVKRYTADPSGGKRYIQLRSAGTYLVITSAYSTNANHQGEYIIGTNSESGMAITAVKSASVVAVADVTNGVLRVTNNGTVTLRIIVITLNGTVSG